MDILVYIVFVMYFQWAQTWHEIEKNPPNAPLLTYPFEGVDYSQLPEKYIKEHNDCYAYYIRCIRYRTDLHAVCGLNTQTGKLEDFFSPCLIDFMNCQDRMSKGIGVGGTNYRDNLIAYNGEGEKCWYYLRLAGSPEGALRIYKHTMPMIVTSEELDILRKGEKMVRVLKGNINFNQDLISKKDSMFVTDEHKKLIINTKMNKGDFGLNNITSNVDSGTIEKLDETLKIRTPNDIISEINSLYPGKTGNIMTRIQKGIDMNVINPDKNSVPKDKGERMIDKFDEMFHMNQDFDELSLGMI